MGKETQAEKPFRKLLFDLWLMYACTFVTVVEMLEKKVENKASPSISSFSPNNLRIIFFLLELVESLSIKRTDSSTLFSVLMNPSI